MECFEKKSRENKIYNFLKEKDKKDNKIIYEKRKKDNYSKLIEMFEELISSDEFKTRIKNVQSDINSKEDKQLIKENKILQMKLGIRTPKVSIVYIIASSISMTFFFMTFLLFIFKGYLIIHPFISLISLIASIGLLITAILSLYEFNDYLKKGDK
ncbi:hypothetical protein [Clostridium sp. L74]|uniref:hypothetical protein n=1 Tax=Clostridium sp. L74 TaxID=1560217 RepID=UPI0006C5E4C8|nr:hypothetical protein [Clostridium sp. L74]KOR24217.1 NADH:ubiquinone reductase (H+-translocating) [Clostridium sp. L74]